MRGEAEKRAGRRRGVAEASRGESSPGDSRRGETKVEGETRPRLGRGLSEA